MTDYYGPTFGGYASPVTASSHVTTASAAYIQVELAKFKALIPDPSDTTPTSAPKPEFDAFTPRMAKQMRAEIDAMAAKIALLPKS